MKLDLTVCFYDSDGYYHESADNGISLQDVVDEMFGKDGCYAAQDCISVEIYAHDNRKKVFEWVESHEGEFAECGKILKEEILSAIKDRTN